MLFAISLHNGNQEVAVMVSEDKLLVAETNRSLFHHLLFSIPCQCVSYSPGFLNRSAPLSQVIKMRKSDHLSDPAVGTVFK